MFCSKETEDAIDDDNNINNKIFKYLELDDRCVHNKLNKMPKIYTQLKFHNEVLKKVFAETGLLSPIEYLDLEYKQFALISFVNLIQFVYEHGENLLSKLSKPVIDEIDDNKLILAFNTLNQLNVTSKKTSLLSILNSCNTSVGKRYFKKMLLNPINSVDALNKRYNNIECFLKTKAWKIIGRDLDSVYDIERMFRNIACCKLAPCNFSMLFNSLTTLDNIFNKLYKNEDIKECCELLNEYVHEDLFTNFKDYCEKNVDISVMYKYHMDDITEPLFCENVHQDLDILNKKRCAIKKNLTDIVNVVDSRPDTLNWLKLESNDREGYHYTITHKRWTILKKSLEKYSSELKNKILELAPLSNTSSNVRLSSEYIKRLNKDLQKKDKEVQELSFRYYQDFLNSIQNTYSSRYFTCVVSLLEQVDFYNACSKNAHTYSLSKPTILDNNNSTSYLNLEDIRHPIIEHVQKNIEYTPNSIYIGRESQSQNNGMILFGVNASGKSSFMKSIGLALIQAQAGMFVPCKSMTYYPYNYIFTRIQSQDNILRGMSTFSNEISELRNIFKRASKNSLIIGDELCSGTESISALSIVTAGIETLVNMNTSFIFATHLHELNSMNRIQEMVHSKHVSIKHLSVEYDVEKGILLYDRKLKDGPGSSLYGLEVCKAMDMSPSFIHLASTIRHEIMNNSSKELVDHKLSKYNSNVIINNCIICESKEELETHHIRFQKDASSDGFIDNRYHKNAEFNLATLCRKCHDNVHNNSLIIKGWKKTSNGIKLDFQMKAEENHNEDKMNVIKTIRKNHTINETINILKHDHNIMITKYMLNKITTHLK